jgi:hypothetical protein
MTSSQSFSFRGATARVNAHEEDRRLARVVAGNLQKPPQLAGLKTDATIRATTIATAAASTITGSEQYKLTASA